MSEGGTKIEYQSIFLQTLKVYHKIVEGGTRNGKQF